MGNYERKIKSSRIKWKQEMFTDGQGKCMACLSTTMQSDLHCHEMVRRSTAPHGWGVRANYLLLCAQCHDSFHRGNFHLGTQLAIKLIEDPKHFNLRTINKISCREKIDLKQVVKYARIVYSF